MQWKSGYALPLSGSMQWEACAFLYGNQSCNRKYGIKMCSANAVRFTGGSSYRVWQYRYVSGVLCSGQIIFVHGCDVSSYGTRQIQMPYISGWREQYNRDNCILSETHRGTGSYDRECEDTIQWSYGDSDFIQGWGDKVEK